MSSLLPSRFYLETPPEYNHLRILPLMEVARNTELPEPVYIDGNVKQGGMFPAYAAHLTHSITPGQKDEKEHAPEFTPPAPAPCTRCRILVSCVVPLLIALLFAAIITASVYGPMAVEGALKEGERYHTMAKIS